MASAKGGNPARWRDGQTRSGLSFTEESLKANQAIWERTFGRPLENYGGSIAKENLANFQVQYSKIRDANRGLAPQEIGNRAIRNVSFGKARIRIGFGDLSVQMGDDFADVTVTEGRYRGQTILDVPTTVTVSARRSPGQGGAP